MTVVLERIAPSHRHVVNDPVVLVVQTHSLLQDHQLSVTFGLAAFIRFLAEHLACLVLQELDAVGTRPDALAEHNLSKVLYRRTLLLILDRAKVEVV